MTYDNIFKKDAKVFGNEPSLLLKLASDFFISKKGGTFLDIGAGQGRDSLYMAKQGFDVYALDKSEVACNQIEKIAKDKKINNLKIIRSDIQNYEIKSGLFDIISAINSLQFLERNESLKEVNYIQEALKKDGIAIISTFVDSHGFKSQELLELFQAKSFKILYYFESVITDPGHTGAPYKHQHEVARIIARKPSQRHDKRYLS